MDDPEVVGNADGRQQLLHEVHRHVDAEAPVLVEPRPHRPAFNPLHDNEEDGAVLVEVVDPHDPRVVQGSHRGRLAVEALAEAEVARILLGEHLDGDRDIEPRVGRAVHHAHGATSQLGLDRVPPELSGAHLRSMPEGTRHSSHLGAPSAGGGGAS